LPELRSPNLKGYAEMGTIRPKRPFYDSGHKIVVNKVILVGRTGANTELKYTGGGKAVAHFSLAINESFRNGAGKQRDRVQWVKSRGESSRRSVVSI
jgi:hypothetical protein